MKLSQSIQLFLLDKQVAGCSPNTLRNYTLTLRRLTAHLDGDPQLADITAEQIRGFLRQLMTTRIAPAGIAKRPARTLSAKTIRNIHTCLSSLWTWAIKEGYAADHIVQRVDAPEPEPPVVEPLSRDQVKQLLNATAFSAPWERSPDTQTELPARRALRDRAILLFLLDTGVRVGELCKLCIADVDISAGTATVSSKGRLNTGAGKKRLVRFSPRTAKLLARYLIARDATGYRDRAQHLFVDRDDRPFDRRYLAKHLHRLGRRAGLNNIHAHRFRHTFAINFLRNGGNIYALQDLLGHTSLEMVRRYARLAEVDIAEAHRRASVVTNWNL